MVSKLLYQTTDKLNHFIVSSSCRRKIIKNRSSLSQTTAYSVSRTVTETSSFSHQAGASVTVGTTFSAGVPFVAKGEISVSATASYSYTTGNFKCYESGDHIFRLNKRKYKIDGLAANVLCKWRSHPLD